MIVIMSLLLPAVTGPCKTTHHLQTVSAQGKPNEPSGFNELFVLIAALALACCQTLDQKKFSIDAKEPKVIVYKHYPQCNSTAHTSQV